MQSARREKLFEYLEGQGKLPRKVSPDDAEEFSLEDDTEFNELLADEPLEDEHEAPLEEPPSIDFVRAIARSRF